MLGLCLLAASCAVNQVKTASYGASASAPSSSAASNPEKVVIPMDRVPEPYLDPDKSRLTLVENREFESPNAVYEDGNGIQYEFDRATGDYRGFFALSQMDVGEGDPDGIPMERLEKAADALAAHFIDPAAYERTYFYQEDTTTHKFRYCRKIQGVETIDLGNVWFSTAGNVINVSFFNTGIFDKAEIPVIDKQELDDRFFASLDADYTFDKILNRTLTMQNGALCILYDYTRVKILNGIEVSEWRQIVLNVQE